MGIYILPKSSFYLACYDKTMNKYLTVDEFLADLSDDRRRQVEKLMSIIASAHEDLTIHIKWNSPSYVLNGEDRVTFNMHYPDQTLILLHMGATRKEDKQSQPIMQDETGLIKWNSDIRGTLSFRSLDEIEKQSKDIKEILQKWFKLS